MRPAADEDFAVAQWIGYHTTFYSMDDRAFDAETRRAYLALSVQDAFEVMVAEALSC